MNRRRFNRILLSASAVALAPFNIARAQAAKLKVGVLLPKSGLQGLIGQSCQKGADLAPIVLKNLLGVDIELMNADTETNVDTARTRAERLIQEGAQAVRTTLNFGCLPPFIRTSIPPKHRRAGNNEAARTIHHKGERH